MEKKFCKNCKVELSNSATKCPLCNQKIDNDNPQTDKVFSSHTQKDSYSLLKNKVWRIIFRCLAGLIVIGIVLLFIFL